jgi:hypothetical protein
MTKERIEELRQKLADPNIGRVTMLPDEELSGLLDLAEMTLTNREKTRVRVANLRKGKTGTEPAKAAQKPRGRPKKTTVVESADTVEAVQEKLAQVTKPILPLTGPEIPGEAPHREKYVKPPEPKPAPSALPKAFWGSLDRVKTPDQLKHDPAATQFKTAKPKKS